MVKKMRSTDTLTSIYLRLNEYLIDRFFDDLRNIGVLVDQLFEAKSPNESLRLMVSLNTSLSPVAVVQTCIHSIGDGIWRAQYLRLLPITPNEFRNVSLVIILNKAQYGAIGLEVITKLEQIVQARLHVEGELVYTSDYFYARVWKIADGQDLNLGVLTT
jgi:hypothetical protein